MKEEADTSRFLGSKREYEINAFKPESVTEHWFAIISMLLVVPKCKANAVFMGQLLKVSKLFW